MQSWSFRIFQSSVSHDPSEIILICWFAIQETFLIINISVENIVWVSHCVSDASVVHGSFITDLLLAILYLWTLLPLSIEPQVKAQRYLTNTQRLMAANYVVQTELITLSKFAVMMVLNPDHVNTVLGQKHRHVLNHVLFFMCSTWNFGNTRKLTPSLRSGRCQRYDTFVLGLKITCILYITYIFLYIYFSVVQSLGSVKLYYFERRLFCSPRLHLFDQKYCQKQ